MREKIAEFITCKRDELKADEHWQEGYDPNDYAAFGEIHGGLTLLKDLAREFGIEWQD